jgi:hypothetical protein
MNELNLPQMCVCIRNGLELWIEKQRAESLLNLLTQPNCPQFIQYEGIVFNKADLVGIFTPEMLETQKHQKKGDWKCSKGNWHDRNDTTCTCQIYTTFKETQSWNEYIHEIGMDNFISKLKDSKSNKEKVTEIIQCLENELKIHPSYFQTATALKELGKIDRFNF